MFLGANVALFLFPKGMFLMGSPHRISHMLYAAAREMTDPGDAGTIRPNKDLQICEITTAAAETRTLARPTKGGIRFIVRLYTDGGDLTLTVTGGMNVLLETEAVFADAGDFLSLVSVKASATTYRWQILDGNVGTVVVSSATPSHTASATPSHTASSTPSSTPSATVSSTPSPTPSHTASSTPSHTASATPSHTPSST